MALGNNSPVNKEFVHTNPYTLASLGFIISLLGWMPAPIDLSTWPSLWMHGREKQTGHKATPREVNIDFSIGYMTTTILACLFLSLGALTIYGSGIELSSNGIKFSGQLIDLYSHTIGGFAKPIIIITAFFTMFSTTLTCLDGYPRSLGVSIKLLREKNDKLITDSKYKLMIVGYAVSASILLFFFVNNLLQLLSFAAIIAFLTSPFLAWINLKVITSSNVPSKFQPPYWMRIISYLGITFFIVVSSIYVYSILL